MIQTKRPLSIALSLIVTTLSISIVPHSAHAWGAKGHQIVSYLGAELTEGNGQAFWQANREGFRQLSTVPDRVWKAPQTKQLEAPTHWFEIDAFVPTGSRAEILNFPKAYRDAIAKYSEPVIVKKGLNPWRVIQLYNLALDAFRSGDNKSALEYAGAMSHYIGDLSQPLHVTENYDGQMTGNSGIHSWFETTIISSEVGNRNVVETRARLLLKDSQFKKELSGDLMDILLKEVARSLKFRDAIIENDTTLGRKSAEAKSVQLNLAQDRMADGAAVLATVLNRLWLEAGLSLKATPIPIEDPAWVELDFSSSNVSRDKTNLHADDCGAH